MEKNTTGESVKTGLQMEANSKHDKLPIAGADTGTDAEDALKETDADELVHQQSNETEPGDEEQDIDEAIHRTTASKTVNDNNEIDPDELVHQK